MSNLGRVAMMVLLVVNCSTNLHPAEGALSVAAAADLRFALDDIITAFEIAHPNTKVQTSYGSSGNFYSQMSQGAPFDIFFSADVFYPQKLIEAGLGVVDSKFSYAIGRLVIWVPITSTIDPGKLGVKALKHKSVRKIAIANPEHAPYGKAAMAAMQKLGVYDSIKDKLVFGENISQTAQFVESGSAEIGIIAMSLAISPTLKDKGRYWEVPVDSYPRLEQGGVILRRSANTALAQDFRAFVLGKAGKAVLRRYGFFMPGES